MPNKFYLLILFFIFLGAAFVLLPLKIKADQVNSLVNIGNALPVTSSVSIDAAAVFVTLIENSTKTVTATFTVTDNNGCEDINSHATLKTKAVFYRTSVAGGVACTPDNANCYAMVCTQDAGTCTAGGADLTASFTCTSAVQFYADATDAGATYSASDWTATATPRDGAGSDGTIGTDTIEMNSLTALDVTSTINYGTLALGVDTGTTDQTTVVTNTGNRQIDTQLDGYGTVPADGFSVVCTIGNIPVGNERYETAASVAYASKIPLTGTAATLSSFDLAPGIAAVKNVYWGFGAPATGIGGSCAGKVNFTPVNG